MVRRMSVVLVRRALDGEQEERGSGEIAIKVVE
jgi:hypothetical protein